MGKIDIKGFKAGMDYVNTGSEDFSAWRFNPEANCYQFATTSIFYLGRRLLPGEISGKKVHDQLRYSDELLVSYVKDDFRALGFTMTKCSQKDKLKEGQWMIAILNCDTRAKFYDFHFLRMLAGDNEHWEQKFVDEQHPMRWDYFDHVITDPAKASYGYDYHLVGYFRIG